MPGSHLGQRAVHRPIGPVRRYYPEMVEVASTWKAKLLCDIDAAWNVCFKRALTCMLVRPVIVGDRADGARPGDAGATGAGEEDEERFIAFKHGIAVDRHRYGLVSGPPGAKLSVPVLAV
jgi:hypothetical protein